MENSDTKLILTEMKYIMNVATIMDMFFKPFEEFRQEKKYTVEEAIKAKDFHVYANRSLANFIKSHNELFGGAFTENHSKILQVISLFALTTHCIVALVVPVYTSIKLVTGILISWSDTKTNTSSFVVLS